MKLLHIFIAEEIPSLNKGEAAILMGILRTFIFFNRVKVSLLSYDAKTDLQRYPNSIDIIDAAKDLHLPRFLMKRHSFFTIILHFLFCGVQHLFFMVSFMVLNRKVVAIMKAKLWKTYMDADVFLIGHNGFLASEPSHLYIVPLAKILRKKIVIYAGGAPKGALTNFLWAKIQKIILNRVDLILLREDISYAYLRKIGITKPPMFVTADPAFLLEPRFTPKSNLIEHAKSTKRAVIGISVNTRRSLQFFPDVNDLRARYILFVTEMAKIADELIDKNKAIIVLIPHALDLKKDLDDRAIATAIYEKIRRKRDVILICQEYAPEEIRDLIGHLDLLISTRLHAIIDAASMHVPFIALTVPRDIRMLGIIKQLEMEKYMLMTQQWNPNELITLINSALNNAEKIRKHLDYKSKIIKRQALKNGILLKTILQF
ncbi:MAG: polysaccharide pyruvyl transferase family protein [Candidatus Bathyarchaeia archaeon]